MVIRLSNCKTPLLATVGLLVLMGLSQIALESSAEARAGGGRSGGFRGSRSYSSPSRPSQLGQSQQGRDASLPTQRPAPFGPQSGGLMRGLGTAVLGGFLGSMLFSGLAHGFGGLGGFGGSGIGLVEILLFGGLAYLVYRKFGRPAVATGYGSMTQSQNPQPYTPHASPGAPDTPSNDIDYRSLAMADRTFNPNHFLSAAQDIFFRVQGAWNKQDTDALGALCGRGLMKTWEDELASMRSRGQQNRMENIALRQSEITEAWTENGEDYITVRLLANLLDYTVDATGAVVHGSTSDPVQFEEYWTYSRPVGPHAWKLTAVHQA